MNVKRCLDRLMKRLGNRTSPTLRADCLEEMILGQERLEGAPELPWFIESERVVTSTTPGERRVALPLDFIREVEDFNLEISEDNVVFHDLSRRTYDRAEPEVSRNADPGIPSLYYTQDDYLVLRPTPDDIYFIRFPTYYAKQSPPIDTEGSENPWFKYTPNLMIAMAGLAISTTQLKDPDLVAYYSGLQTSEENRLVRIIVAKQEENRDRRMG